MSLRGWVKRLEREARGDFVEIHFVEIRQRDGHALHLRCTNSDAEVHAGGIGQTWTHSITSGEARGIGIS